MAVGPVAVSLMVSFMSAVTLLGVSSENYTYGVQFVVINVSYILGTAIAAHLYLPVFFRLQATSAYEVLSGNFYLSNRNPQNINASQQNVNEGNFNLIM